jgi:putative ABC transport system permease protein
MRLILLNILRKPLRSLLTILGVAIALFLFCFLETLLDAFNLGVYMADASRLIVAHRESIVFSLPISYQQAIQQVPGVKRAAGATWFGGPYEEPRPEGVHREEFFAQFAADLESWLPAYPEIRIAPEQLHDLLADRSGCVLGDKLAERIHKKLGDRIVLKGTIWTKPDGSPWEFTVRALYTTDSPTFDRTMMLFHLKYLDEGRQYEKNTVSLFIVSLEDPNRYQEVAGAIDARFENSPWETRSMTEKAFNIQFISMMGNLQLLIRSIGFAVVLTMLLVSANTMMMSARERTREMGILKALGFSDGRIFALLIGEALLISGIGAVLGAGVAFVSFNLLQMNPKPDFFPVFILPLTSLVAAFGIAALTGFLSGLVPAIAGARLKATEALGSV